MVLVYLYFIIPSPMKYMSPIPYLFIGISLLLFLSSHGYFYSWVNQSFNLRNIHDQINYIVENYHYFNQTSIDSNHQTRTDFQDQFNEYGNKSVVIYNTYRTGINSFTSVGMMNRSRMSIDFIRVDIGNCIWKEAKTDVVFFGNLSVIIPGDHHWKDYEAVLLNCTFSWTDDTHTNGELYISMEKDQFKIYQQGFDDMVVNTELLISNARSKYKNIRKFLNGIMRNGYTPLDGDVVYDVAYCSPPNFGPLDQKVFVQWMEYHIGIGVQHFTFYDAGIENLTLHQVLSAYVREKIADIINYTSVRNYNIWNYGQVLSNNDCNLRMRNLAKWVLFTDFDEYLTLPYRIESLSSFLTHYEGKACISFGALFWNIDYCIIKKTGVSKSREENIWAIEALVFRRSTFRCALNHTLAEYCPSHFGHRKVVSSPSHSSILLMHDCLCPSSESSLVNLSANVAHLNHYRGLPYSPFNASRCFSSVDEVSLPGYFFDDSMAKFVKRIRRSYHLAN